MDGGLLPYEPWNVTARHVASNKTRLSRKKTARSMFKVRRDAGDWLIGWAEIAGGAERLDGAGKGSQLPCMKLVIHVVKWSVLRLFTP